MQEFFHLKPALDRQKTEVSDNHAHQFAVNFEIGVDSTPRFIVPISKIQISNIDNGVAGKQCIAVVAVLALDHRPGNSGKASRAGQIIHLVQIFGSARIGIDLLKADDPSTALLDHFGDASRISLAISADTAMNIV